MKALSRLVSDESGATAIEYALLVALIAAVIVIVVLAVGGKTSSNFESINSAMP